MLNEQEKQEMREAAASTAVREEFRVLRKYSAPYRGVNLDRFIRFLTAMSRLKTRRVRLRSFVHYTNVKL